MITIEQATDVAALLDVLGCPWQPRSGDRFVLPGREIDQVFVVSEMTVEVAELTSGRQIRFNGTTEWALDSIDAAEVLWLPWEHQLRDLLGDRFLALARVDEGFAVTLADGSRHVDIDPETAYAAALLS